MADLRSYFTAIDLDTGGGTDYVLRVSLNLSASGGAIEAIGQKAMASSIPVVVASDQSAISVDTELPAAGALADGTSNPTTPLIGAAAEIFNGSTWDRWRSVANGQDTTGTGVAAAGILGQFDDASTGSVTENSFAPVRISTRRALLVEGVASGTNLNVAIAASSATVTVDTELAAAASLGDNTANPSVTSLGTFPHWYDGSTWDRARGDSTDGLLVNLGTNNDVTITGSVTVDSELPAAASLADATANPTVPGVGGFLMGFNGTTWDRVRTANTGRLQVDVLSGAGVTTPTNPATDYVTSAAVAAGAEANLDTGDLPAKSLAQVTVWSSVAYRCRVFLVNNSVEGTEALAVGGGQAFMPWVWEPPHAAYATLGTSGGTDAFRLEFINGDDANAADAHAVFIYQG